MHCWEDTSKNSVEPPDCSEGTYPISQCEFRKDMIFTARQLQGKRKEQNIDLFMTFVDLTKAFDRVSSDGLENHGQVWLSTQIHSNGAAFMVACKYVCKMMLSSLNHLR